MFSISETGHLNFSDEIVLFNEGARLVMEGMDEYQETDLFEDMMESFGKNKKDGTAEKDANAAKEEANDKAVEKTQNGFMKIIDAIMNMIRKIKDSITDFFDKRKLDAEQKAAYESFKIACKKDPALKNKKITVANWKKIDGEYKEFINDCQKRLEMVKKDEKTPIQDLIDRGKKLTGGAIKGAVTSVAASSVMAMATTDRQTAQFLRNLLNQENAKMEQIRKDMGRKQYKKLDKELKKMSRSFSIHRLIVEITGQHYDNYKDAILSPLRSIKSWAKVATGETELDKDTVIDMAGDRTGRQLIGNLRRNQGIRDATGATVGRAAKSAVKVGVKGTMSGLADKLSYVGRKAFSPRHAADKNLAAPDDPTGYRRSRIFGKKSSPMATALTPSAGGNIYQQRRAEKKKKKKEATASLSDD